MKQKPLLLTFALFLAGWLVLSSPWLLGSYTIPFDAKAHFQAQIHFLANAIHSGQSPFWTPNVFAGSPQVADPQSLIFSPALLLALLTPSPSFAQVDGFILALLGLGGLSIAMLFRDRDWHPASAVLAGLAFSFGSSAAWRIQHVGQIMSYALFGVTLFLLARALSRRSLAYGIGAGVAAASMVVKPDQVALLSCYALIGFVVDHWLRGDNRREAFVASLKPLLGAGITCIVLAGLPLLMTVLFASSTSRSEIPFDLATRGSLHPVQLLTGLIADLFGALDGKVDFWGPSSGAWGNANLDLSQNMGQIYVGVIPALLVLTIGFTRGLLWAREVRYFTILLLAMIAYALGSYSALFELVYHYLPAIKQFRRPADATFLLGAAAGICAGYLLHRLLTGTVPAASARMRWLEAGIIVTLFAAGVAVAMHEGMLAVAAKPISIAALWALAGLGVLYAAIRIEPRWRNAACALVTTFMIADLGVNNGPNESTALSSVNYELLKPDCTNETVRFLKARLHAQLPSDRRDRVELAGVGFDWPNIGMIQGFDNSLGYNPLRLADFAEATGAGDTVASPNQRRFTPLFPSYRSTFANLLGIRYIATSAPIAEMDHNLAPTDLRLLARTKDAYIYENPNALPRVMFVQHHRLADFGQLRADGKWPEGFDPRKELILEDIPSDDRPASTASPASQTRVRLLRYENTYIDVSVDAAQPGFVLLNDVWHPWWTATLNGEETAILRANVLFRAVRVPQGRHILRFEFKPFEGAVAQFTEKLVSGEEPAPDPMRSAAATPADPALSTPAVW